jgi:peroxiredoxin
VAAPEKRFPEEQGRVFYQGESLTGEIVFGSPATLRGQITDDAGRPLAGAVIELGVVRDERTGRSTWSCSLLDSSSRSLHIDDRTFASIWQMPTALLKAETDAEGNYVFTGLPREVRLLGRIAFQPGYEQRRFTLATSADQVDRPRMECVGYDGILNHTFKVPRLLRVEVLCADTSTPAANVRVRVRGKRLVTDGNQATSDGDGRLELRLTPGEYTLIADPAWNEPYVTTEQQIVVSEETREQEIALALARGGTVVLSAVDIASGKPLAGVDFLVGPDTSPERQVLQSQTVIVDNPATDAEGRLQATLPAGSYQFIVGTVPAGYEAIRKTSDPCTLAAGETQDVRFEFRRVSPVVDAAAPPATSNESPYPADLVEKWTRQRNLRTRGRAKLSVIRAPFSWLYKDKLEGILAAADPEKIPDLIGALEREYPEQTIVFGEMEIASDGSRHREVHSYAGKISSVLAANGKEGVEFHPDNAQADVFARSHFRVGLFNIRELSYWPQLSARPASVNPNDAPRVDVETVGERLKITLRPAAAEPAAWTSSIIADAKTGFIYSTISDHGTNGLERWQFAPKEHPGGAILPGLSVKFTHRDGKVGLLEVYRIESLELDGEFPLDAFTVSAPAGTNVLDHRDGSSGNPTSLVAFEPLVDVVSFANKIPYGARSRAEIVKVGDAAPVIDPETWLNQEGRIAAPDLSGKVVLVDFWGIGCGPCIAELPEVQAAFRRYREQGLVIVGLHASGESIETVAEFARKRGLTYPLAIDRDGPKGYFGKTCAAYGVRGIPQAAVINREGRLVYQGQFEAAIAKAEELLKSRAE